MHALEEQVSAWLSTQKCLTFELEDGQLRLLRASKQESTNTKIKMTRDSFVTGLPTFLFSNITISGAPHDLLKLKAVVTQLTDFVFHSA